MRTPGRIVDLSEVASLDVRPVPSAIEHFATEDGRIFSCARGGVLRERRPCASPRGYPASARVLRNCGARWTESEDALLRSLWGHAGERKLRDVFGRTTWAICRRAQDLKLPPQSEITKLSPLWTIARHLGIDYQQLRRFLRSCALDPELRAPASYQSRGFYRHHALCLEQVEALYLQRVSRSATCDAWAREAGISHRTVLNALDRERVRAWNARPGAQRRLPVGVIEEVMARVSGPWRVVWAEVLAASDRAALPCDAWLLALAAHDAAHLSAIASAWVGWLPQKAEELARQIARRVKRGRECAA